MSGIITLEKALATIESGPATIESIRTTIESGLATAEAALTTAESNLITSGAASILDYEIFEGVPLWVVVLIISTTIFITLIITLISWIFHAEKEVKKKVHHVPTSHEVVIELQKELLKSIKSSSRQNWLMIVLTILFITVSVIGGAVVLNFFHAIKDFCATWFSQFVEYLNSILSK